MVVCEVSNGIRVCLFTRIVVSTTLLWVRRWTSSMEYYQSSCHDAANAIPAAEFDDDGPPHRLMFRMTRHCDRCKRTLLATIVECYRRTDAQQAPAHRTPDDVSAR